MIHVGTCGFCLPQREFFRTFSLVEVQQTFYWPPRLTTVERWRREAPADFEFALKAFQAITHPGTSPTYRKAKLTEDERAGCGMFRGTNVVREAWEITRRLAEALAARWVVFQCPPQLGATEENLANLRRFFGWARRDELYFGWELRHPGWTAQLVGELCRELGLIHVVDPFEQTSAYGTPRYFRLHGKAKSLFRYEYKYQYGDEELRQLAQKCAGGDVYCLFNNAAMKQDAQRFRALAATARK